MPGRRVGGDDRVRHPPLFRRGVERAGPPLTLRVEELELVVVDRADGPAGLGREGVAIAGGLGDDRATVAEVEPLIVHGLAGDRRASPGVPHGAAVEAEADVPNARSGTSTFLDRRRGLGQVLDEDRLGVTPGVGQASVVGREGEGVGDVRRRGQAVEDRAVGHRPEFDAAGDRGEVGLVGQLAGDDPGGEPRSVRADRERLDRARGLPRQRNPDGQARRVVPEERSALGAHDDVPVVRADGQGQYLGLQGSTGIGHGGNRERLVDESGPCGIGHVVDSEVTVDPSGHESRPLGKIGQRVDRALGLLQDPNLAAGDDVPDPDGLVVAAGGEEAAVGREHERADGVGMAGSAVAIDGRGQLADHLAGALRVDPGVAQEEDLAPRVDHPLPRDRQVALASGSGDRRVGHRRDLASVASPERRADGPGRPDPEGA